MVIRSKRLTPKVSKGIKDSKVETPPNPFVTGCRHITRPRRIPVDDNIKNPRIGARTRFAFISFDKFSSDDFIDDFIPLCGQCQKKIGIEKCYQGFLNRSFQEEQSCQRGLDVEACDRKLLKHSAALREARWQHYRHALTEALDVLGANI